MHQPKNNNSIIWVKIHHQMKNNATLEFNIVNHKLWTHVINVAKTLIGMLKLEPVVQHQKNKEELYCD